MTNNGLISRRLVVLVGALVVIIIAGYVSRLLIMNGARFVKLPPAQPLVGQASQALIANGSNKVLSSAGYALKNTHYFDNNSWAVATLIPPKGNGNKATIVMQKVGQFYQVVLGPGTAFPGNVEIGLPPDVAGYLYNNGLIYNASG